MRVYRLMRAVADVGLYEDSTLDEAIRLLLAFLAEQRDRTQCTFCAEERLRLLSAWNVGATRRRGLLERFKEAVTLYIEESEALNAR